MGRSRQTVEGAQGRGDRGIRARSRTGCGSTPVLAIKFRHQFVQLKPEAGERMSAGRRCSAGSSRLPPEEPTMISSCISWVAEVLYPQPTS